MTQARIAREATAVAVSEAAGDTAVRLAREATAVAHHFPEANTSLRLASLRVNVAISRPHGWDIFDDPAL